MYHVGSAFCNRVLLLCLHADYTMLTTHSSNIFLSLIVASCSSPAASGRARLPQCLGAQVMIHEVLEAWGNGGLQTHVRKMQTEYKKRAAIVQEAAGKVYSSIV